MSGAVLVGPSRTLPRLGIAVGCVALFLVFCLVRFPFASFRGPLQARLADLTGAEVQIGSLDGAPGLGLVGLRLRDLRVAWPDGRQLVLDAARMRPAWSLSWLRGRPALHLDLRGPQGRVVGTLWPDAAQPGFDGSLEEVALDAVGGLHEAARELALQGTLSGDVAIRRLPDGIEGTLSLRAREGAFAPPGSPLAVPFESLRADARFGPATGLALDEVLLAGPLVSGTLRGQVGPGVPLEEAPIDLEVQLDRIDPGVQQMARGLGLGRPVAGTPIRVQGTLSDPLVR